ncbi:hypothetical protein [Paraburkholderia tropica]|uniref:hypothetical protein n=1 Tax=Paraburkholderia tropica TaxID=92647 RepID=UPI002ABDF3E6|nr:hypothetical protein [Paraburkholderia tropica]
MGTFLGATLRAAHAIQIDPAMQACRRAGVQGCRRQVLHVLRRASGSIDTPALF